MKFIILLLINFVSFFSFAQKQQVPAGIYDFKIAAFHGGVIDLSEYKGKKILIVNVPCMNDYDQQYTQLNKLYEKYKDKLVVIGVFADDFAVPPGTKLSTSQVNKHYDVSFPLAQKVKIKGPDAATIYQWLTEKEYNNFKDSNIKWDFQKYLINEKGYLIAVFDPKVKAFDQRIISAVEN